MRLPCYRHRTKRGYIEPQPLTGKASSLMRILMGSTIRLKFLTNNITILFLISACILSIIRLLSPLKLTTDPSIQIGAALSLLNGEGLNNQIVWDTKKVNSDISQGVELFPLLGHAPGFSLLVFLLLKLGFSLEIGLKLIYTIATLVAWLGWGLVFARIIYLIDNLSFMSSILALIFAVILPLYFTFDWCGTDIFLCCGIPFIVYFI